MTAKHSQASIIFMTWYLAIFYVEKRESEQKLYFDIFLTCNNYCAVLLLSFHFYFFNHFHLIAMDSVSVYRSDEFG